MPFNEDRDGAYYTPPRFQNDHDSPEMLRELVAGVYELTRYSDMNFKGDVLRTVHRLRRAVRHFR